MRPFDLITGIAKTHRLTRDDLTTKIVRVDRYTEPVAVLIPYDLYMEWQGTLLAHEELCRPKWDELARIKKNGAAAH